MIARRRSSAGTPRRSKSAKRDFIGPVKTMPSTALILAKRLLPITKAALAPRVRLVEERAFFFIETAYHNCLATCVTLNSISGKPEIEARGRPILRDARLRPSGGVYHRAGLRPAPLGGLLRMRAELGPHTPP